MKKIKIFLLFYAIVFLGLIAVQGQKKLIEVEIDSIYDTSNVSEVGNYQIYMDSIPLVPTHDKYIKAVLRLNSLAKKYPNVNLFIKHPEASKPTGTAKYFIEAGKLNSNSETLKNEIDSLKQTDVFQGHAINDLYISKLPAIERKIDALDKLYKGKINVLQKRIETLQTFIKDTVAFVCECNHVDKPIIDKLTSNWTGWAYNDQSYDFIEINQYTNEVYTNSKFSYLVFDLNKPIEIGQSYSISFEIEKSNGAIINFWLYPEEGLQDFPEGYINPSITSNGIYENGIHTFDYEEIYLKRLKFGIRASKDGGSFTIKNINITEK